MKWWLVLLFVPMAGCLATEPTEGGTPVQTEPVDPWYNVTLYVGPQGLSETAPENGTIPLGWSIPQWLAGVQPPSFEGESQDLHRIVASGTMHFVYRAAQDTASGDARPELTSWFGAGDTVIHHVFSDGPDELSEGDVVITQEALRFPEGGFHIPGGDAPRVRLGSYYLDSPQMQTMEVMVGPEGTRIDLRMRDHVMNGTTVDLRQEETVTLAGNRCVFDGNAAGTAQKTWTVAVTNKTARIGISVDPGSGVTDIDMSIRGPGGEDVGGSHGPADDEAAFAWWTAFDAIGPGDYKVSLFACTPQTKQVDVTFFRVVWTDTPGAVTNGP